MAAKGDVGRQPLGGVFVGFLLVSRTIDSEEIEGILTEGFALSFIEAIGAGGPSVTKGHDVVDLDSAAGAGAAYEIDNFSGVGVVESAGQHEATVKDGVDEVALEDDIAHVAAFDGAPAGIKIGADVFLLGVSGVDLEFFKNNGGGKFGLFERSFGLDGVGLIIVGVGD